MGQRKNHTAVEANSLGFLLYFPGSAVVSFGLLPFCLALFRTLYTNYIPGFALVLMPLNLAESQSDPCLSWDLSFEIIER